MSCIHFNDEEIKGKPNHFLLLGFNKNLSTTFCFEVFCGYYYFAHYGSSISALFRKAKLCHKYKKIIQNK